MSHTLTLAEFQAALRQSFALLKARPLQWLVVTIVFLLIEALSFIPYIGFTAKLAVAGLLLAQWLVMCGEVAAGGTPRLATFAGALTRPFSAQWVLVAAGVVPFVVGAIYLMLVGGGWQGAEFFIGRMNPALAPGIGRFFVFKLVMECVGAWLAFVPGAVALCGLTGLDAWTMGLRTAIGNWRLIVLSIVFGIAVEGVFALLAQAVPVLGILASAAVLIAYLAWMVVLTYTVSVRAFDLVVDRPAPREGYDPVDVG